MTESGEGPVTSRARTVKPQEALRLACTVTGASITDGYGYSWVRLSPPKGLEWLGWGYYSSSSWHTRYGPAFQSRISITPDYSKQEFSLQLNTVADADSGTYFCARLHGETGLSWHCTKKGSWGCVVLTETGLALQLLHCSACLYWKGHSKPEQ